MHIYSIQKNLCSFKSDDGNDDEEEEEEEEEQGRFGITENRVFLVLVVTASRQLTVDHAVTVNTSKL
jgi:hypothetical protein